MMSWSKVGGAIIAVLGAMSVGCGVSPAYEEPQVPMSPPPPASSEELAQRTQESQEATGAIGGGSDIPIGESTDEYADTDPSALTEWRPVLDGHGRWVDDSTYGTVWIPSENEVGNDFQPYVSAGHWTYAEDTSWVWVSDYSWGWVPFHYGRWVYLNGYGWSWIPGRRYAGAWVTWRYGYGYDYVGWAPMGPDYYWYNGWAVGWSFGWYHPYYVYCHHGYVYDHGVSGHVVRGGTPAGAQHDARTTPYQPAAPGVGANGGRVPAKPGVNDRVVAQPSVVPGVNGGAGRTSAAAPSPAQMGIRGAVTPPPPHDAGLERAQAFASPRTATPLGAAPPSSPRPRRVEPDMVATAPREHGINSRPMSPSVASRLEPAARAPQVAGSQPVPPRQSSPSFVERPGTAPIAQGPRSLGPSPLTPSSPMPRQTSPSFGQAQPTAVPRQTAPSFSQAPMPSRPSVFSHSSPSFSSPPTFRPSAPSVSHSAPTFRPSMPSAPIQHSAPSFSRSSPTIAPHTSAPVRSGGSAPSRSSTTVRSRR